MSRATFKVSDVNPNDAVGGGGCVCSPDKATDCKGPYAVFYATDMWSEKSPHVVVSFDCALAFVNEAADPDAALAAGEHDLDVEVVIEGTAEEVVPEV